MEHWMAHGHVLGGQKLLRGQTRLLSLISQNNGTSQRDLAEEMDVRPYSMTEMLIRMEQTNLITRKQDEKDQRIMLIFFTEIGEKEAKQSSVAAFDLTTIMFNCLTPEEQIQMLAFVEKISASLETIVGSDARDAHHHGMHKHHGHHRHHCRHHSPFHAEDRKSYSHF
jgi:DNA-binding MarR family transcriptional regulator